MKNNKLKLTLKYTFFMSVVLVASLIIIYIVSDRARHESFQGTLRSEAITKTNLFLENNVDVSTMQHIYLNNTQFINEVEVAVYTRDFRMLYHDAAENDIVKETPDMIRQICERGEMAIPVAKGYQAVGILYSPSGNTEEGLVVTAAAHDGYGETNMIALRNTLLLIFIVSIVLMSIVGYLLATLTIRPIEHALTAQKMFASNVSHELRTPLAAIMGELGLALQKERTPEDYQSRIGRALDDASRMSDTIIGLLNLARAEYDASQIKMESIRVDELLMDVIEEMLRAKPEYHINLSFAASLNPLLSPVEGNDSIRMRKSSLKGDIEGLEGPSIIANRYLIALAFRNLIENNCKYSSNHTSHVVIDIQHRLSIVFADNGVGMTPTERRNLFRMFYRGSNHAEEGHGIGMALVQRILALHNACVDVQSKEGHGTKFIIIFSDKEHRTK